MKSMRDELMEVLSTLDERDTQRVLDFAQQLLGKPPKGMPLSELLRHRGMFSSEELDQMEAAINEAFGSSEPEVRPERQPPAPVARPTAWGVPSVE